MAKRNAVSPGEMAGRRKERYQGVFCGGKSVTQINLHKLAARPQSGLNFGPKSWLVSHVRCPSKANGSPGAGGLSCLSRGRYKLIDAESGSGSGFAFFAYIFTRENGR